MKKTIAFIGLIVLVASSAFGFGWSSGGGGWRPPAGGTDGQMLAWDSATNSIVWTTGTGTGDLLAGTLGATGSVCVKNAADNTIDCTGAPNITVGTITTTPTATPLGIINDSDSPGTDKEIAAVGGSYVDGADGAENGTHSLYVHEAGTRTEYIQLDGKNAQVEVNKPLAMGANSIVTTGTLSGGVDGLGTFAAPITDNPYTLTAANSYNKILYYGATGTINHADAADGENFCVYNTGAFTVTFNPGDNTVIVREGTAQSAGVSITLSSGAGNFVCFHGDAANHLVTMGSKGTLAEGS